jgi:hypothetical protein
MIAQRFPPRDRPEITPLRYLALVKCMEDVGMRAAAHGSIVCPLFGAGLAGGDWAFIKLLIAELWLARDINVTVFQLPPLITPSPTQTPGWDY